MVFITEEKQKSFIVNLAKLGTRNEEQNLELPCKPLGDKVHKFESINYSDSKFQKLSSALKQNLVRRKNSKKSHIEDNRDKSESN